EYVRSLAKRGLRQDEIAAKIGCRDPKTVRKYFRDELDCGTAEANEMVIGALLAKALGGDVTAQIFWLKVRAQWRESKDPEKPIPSSDAGPASPATIVLPDNNRDPGLTEELRKAQEKYYARKQRRQPRKPKSSDSPEQGPGS